jgi:hypothetical protein
VRRSTPSVTLCMEVLVKHRVQIREKLEKETGIEMVCEEVDGKIVAFESQASKGRGHHKREKHTNREAREI